MVNRRKERSRAEENLAFWHGLVGLDSTFPALEPLADDDLQSHVVTDEAQMDAIRASLASQQLNQILVEAGWGATTLFRYLIHDARDHAMDRLTLPVALDFEVLFVDRDITPDALTYEIRRQLIGLLLDSPWEQTLHPDFYFECINYEESMTLSEYKVRANKFLFYDRAPSPRELVRHFPWLRGPLSNQATFLLNKLRIQTALYIHLPRDISSQRLRDLVASIKWITQQSTDIEYAAWREVYICSATLKGELNRDFKRPWQFIDYQKYTPAQIYTMLIRRYQPLLSGLARQRRLSLTEVFSAEFVDNAWREAESLVDLSTHMRAAVLRRLDCPSSEVPFRLEPPTANHTDGSSSGAPKAPAETLGERLARRKAAAAGGGDGA